jgi:DNA anti-recombination protein RmuC
MTQAEMANHVANEILEEVADLKRRFVIFGERYIQLGSQFADLITAEKKAELEASFKDFCDTIEAIGL